MRKLFLLLLISSNLMVLAQKEYTISNKTPYAWAPLADGEVNIHTSLINAASNSNDTTFQIVFIDANMPAGWSLGLCSDAQCYAVNLSTGLNEQIYTQKGKTTDLKCTMSYASPPNAGCGNARFAIYRAGMSNLADTIVFSTCAPATGVNGSSKAFSASISPNPVKNDLILTVSDNHINSLSIINLIGKEVMKLDFKSGKSFDVSALPNGIYFLQITKGDASFKKKFVISR